MSGEGQGLRGFGLRGREEFNFQFLDNLGLEAGWGGPRWDGVGCGGMGWRGPGSRKRGPVPDCEAGSSGQVGFAFAWALSSVAGIVVFCR